jgi:hypothetical protein
MKRILIVTLLLTALAACAADDVETELVAPGEHVLLPAPAAPGNYQIGTTIMPTGICEGYVPAFDTNAMLKADHTVRLTDWTNRVFAGTWAPETGGFALQPLPGQLDYLGTNWSVPAVTHFVASSTPGVYRATIEWRDATRPQERCFFPTVFILQ